MLIKKTYKGSYKNKEYSLLRSSLVFGDFGIKAKHKGKITAKQIEAFRKVITKVLKNFGKLWILCKPNMSVARKKKGMRMGKGKGDDIFWYYNVKAGMILFEINSKLSYHDTVKILKSASKKLPICTSIIFKKY